MRAPIALLVLAAAACRPAPMPRIPESGGQAAPVTATPEHARALPAPIDPQAAHLRRRAIAAMDAGRLSDARDLIDRALSREPENAALLALADWVERALAEREPERVAKLPEPIVLPEPPWGYRLAREVPTAPLVAVPRLLRRSSKRNQITDEAQWFARNDLIDPRHRAPRRPGEPWPEDMPPFLPHTYRGTPLRAWLTQDTHILAIYEAHVTLGPNSPIPDEGPQILAIFDAESGTLLSALDFANYRVSPRTPASDRWLASQELTHAWLQEGVLYVSHGHWTYAKSSGGQTGYVTALDPVTGELFWRSEPRVSNARTFVSVGPYLVTGYGFTAEPDALMALRRKDGVIMVRTRLHSAPEYLFDKDGTLLVRAYDHDYTYKLQIPDRKPPAILRGG